MADGLKFQLQFKKCITFAILNYTPHPKKSTKMNGLATCTIFRTLAFTTIVETNIEAGIMEPLFSIWKYSISILSSEAGYSDWRFSWFSLVPPPNCYSTLKYVTLASFHILSSSPSTTVLSSDIKYTKKQLIAMSSWIFHYCIYSVSQFCFSSCFINLNFSNENCEQFNDTAIVYTVNIFSLSSLLSNGYGGLFPQGLKWLGIEADHSLPSSAKVKECMVLYLKPPSTSLWYGAYLSTGQLYIYLYQMWSNISGLAAMWFL